MPFIVIAIANQARLDLRFAAMCTIIGIEKLWA